MLISQKTSEKTAFNQTNKRKIIQVGKKVQRLDNRTVRKGDFQKWKQFLLQGQRSEHVNRDSYKPVCWAPAEKDVLGILRLLLCRKPSANQRHDAPAKVYWSSSTKSSGKEISWRFRHFQQDRAPCHTWNIVKNFMTEKNIPILDRPGDFPDVNAIENFGANVKVDFLLCKQWRNN